MLYFHYLSMCCIHPPPTNTAIHCFIVYNGFIGIYVSKRVDAIQPTLKTHSCLKSLLFSLKNHRFNCVLVGFKIFKFKIA
jgi:hypothetical protein